MIYTDGGPRSARHAGQQYAWTVEVWTVRHITTAMTYGTGAK